jgi:hypothetical protein
MVRKILLFCGILAALLYVGSDIIAAMRWEGYSYTAQSVSELRAIGAPTRSFLLPILFIYALLEIAFGLGVWGTAGQKRALRITGGLLIGLGILDLMGPFFQLNLGEAVESFTNTLHLIVTAVTVLLIFLIIGFGATADGTWFRFYSYATLVIILVAGVWSFLDLPRIAANLPTPWLGVRERINIYGYMLWMLVFAIVLLRSQSTVSQGNLGGSPPKVQLPQPKPSSNLRPSG